MVKGYNTIIITLVEEKHLKNGPNKKYIYQQKNGNDVKYFIPKRNTTQKFH